MPTSRGSLNSEETRHKILIPVLICLALAIITIITFSSLKDCGFINLDDNIYVYENAYVQSGLNWNSIIRAFSSELVEKSGNWHPLTWLSLMLDYQIFGLNPSGYHLMNLLFHVMNTLLLFLVLHRMTKTHLAQCLCSRSVCNTSPPYGVCRLDNRAQGCSFHFLLDAHHRSVQLLCGTSGFPKIFFCSSVFHPGPDGETHAGNPPFCTAAFGLLASAAFWGNKTGSQNPERIISVRNF